MPFVLGVDSSSQSTLVELRDADSGEIFGSGRAAHADPTASIEQEPLAWWNALVDARRDAGGTLGVSAVAVAAQLHGLVVVDQEGQVIRPARMRDDPEASRDAESLVHALGGPEQWVHACGSVPDGAFSVAKLAWLRRTEPGEFARIAKVMAPHSWLTFRLSRKVVTDRAGASATGYYSPRDSEWRPDLLALVDPDKSWGPCLPRVFETSQPAGDRDGVMIAPGTGEPMAAALGVVLQPRDVVVSLDHGYVFTIRDRPTEDPSGRVQGLADGTGRFLPCVSSTGAIGALTSFARVLGVDANRFDRLALEAPPGAQGVMLRPAGTRIGSGRRAAGGVLSGFDANLSPELVARAAVEGVAHQLLDDVDALRHADVPVGGRFILLGGGRSHALTQALADLSGRAVALPKGDRAVAGACVLAAAAFHGSGPGDLALAWGLDRARELEPNPNTDAEELRAVHKAAVRNAEE
ncbi:MAG: xylulose kinase [Acidimicrobiia bacterium]|nr:xylulose kinase [Acidimicrobiia bacterium]